MKKIVMSAVLLFGFSTGAMEPKDPLYEGKVQAVISTLTDPNKKIGLVRSCKLTTQDLSDLSAYSFPSKCHYLKIEGGELDLDTGIACYSIKVGSHCIVPIRF